MIRLLSILVLLLLILTVIRSFLVRLFGPPGGEQRVPPRPRQKVTGRMIKDPQCGMYVAEDLAIEARTHDAVFYFCSIDCRDRYAKARLKEMKG